MATINLIPSLSGYSFIRSLRRLMTRRLLSDRTPPPDLSLLFAKVLRKLSLDFSTGELGHGLCTFYRTDAVRPSTGEDDVHFFQTPALWFWEEEVDGGDQGGVQDRKDDVCPPCGAMSVGDLQVVIYSTYIGGW